MAEPAPAVLRPACSGDMEALARLHARCFPAEPWSAEALAMMLGQPGVSGLLADSSGQPLGLLLLRRTTDEAEILSLGVDPAWRRRGLARQLLALGLEVLGGEVRQVFLEVDQDNAAARRLYAAFDFFEVGRRENYYRGVTPALVLRRVPGDFSHPLRDNQQ